MTYVELDIVLNWTDRHWQNQIMLSVHQWQMLCPFLACVFQNRMPIILPGLASHIWKLLRDENSLNLNLIFRKVLNTQISRAIKSTKVGCVVISKAVMKWGYHKVNWFPKNQYASSDTLGRTKWFLLQSMTSIDRGETDSRYNCDTDKVYAETAIKSIAQWKQ